MERVFAGIFTGLALVLTAGAAEAQAAPAAPSETVAALKSPADPKSLRDEGIGVSALAWGENWTAVKLLERAVSAHPTVINRFDLATAYENTGQYDKAVRLYRGLIRDGQFTNVNLNPTLSMGDNRNVGMVRVNIADEAGRRMARIGGRSTLLSQPAAGAPGDGDTRPYVTPDPNDISDQAALDLDRAAREAHAPR